MSTESNDPSENLGLAVNTAELSSLPNVSPPALAEIINRSLVHIQTSKTLGRLHRIGDHELQWPDYQLIYFWAEQSNIPPAALLKTLLEYKTDFKIGHQIECRTILRDGRFVNLFVDPKLSKITCIPQIKELQIKILFVAQLGLFDLNLSAVPHLTALFCFKNYLTKIDLSAVPNLNFLVCHKNHLNDLILSPVADLIGLLCDDNYITNLELSSTPNLRLIGCAGNRLSALDLSPLPYLTMLVCAGNQLTELDLSPVINLKDLVCTGNQLTNLDLSWVPNLKELRCKYNPLSELDIRPLQRLETLKCDSIRLIQRPDQNFK